MEAVAAWLGKVSRVLVLHPNRLSPSPLKLTLLIFAWILPYLLVSLLSVYPNNPLSSLSSSHLQFANYLERSLLPLRLLCYTQSDLLSDRPLNEDLQTCRCPRSKRGSPSRHVQVFPEQSTRPELSAGLGPEGPAPARPARQSPADPRHPDGSPGHRLP